MRVLKKGRKNRPKKVFRYAKKGKKIENNSSKSPVRSHVGFDTTVHIGGLSHEEK